MTTTILLALVSGLLIGCIGIGGVLLVPGLTFAGIDVHAAIAASMFSFVFSGIIGVWLYAREGSVEWGPSAWLALAAMPGALAGSLLASHLSGDLLLMFVGAAVIFAGARSLRRRAAATAEDGASLAPPALLAIGAVVGVASAMTGTGGPLLLVPILLWLRTPVLRSVGLSQVIQIPIAGFASFGNLLAGTLDLRLGVLLSIGVALGAAVGAHAAHRLPTTLLTRLVAVILLLVGVLVIARSSQVLALAWS